MFGAKRRISARCGAILNRCSNEENDNFTDNMRGERSSRLRQAYRDQGIYGSRVVACTVCIYDILYKKQHPNFPKNICCHACSLYHRDRVVSHSRQEMCVQNRCFPLQGRTQVRGGTYFGVAGDRRSVGLPPRIFLPYRKHRSSFRSRFVKRGVLLLLPAGMLSHRKERI